MKLRGLIVACAVLVLALVPLPALASHSSTDWDGDGYSNSIDNCPLDYNKPLGMSPQYLVDFDDDGVGDVCDPTPYSNDPGFTHYMINWYFLDGNQEPHPGPVCNTYTDFTPGWPPDSDYQCLSNGEMDGVLYFDGANGTTWTIACDAGGSISGAVEDADRVIVLPLTENCQISGTHLWGGTDDGPATRYAPLVYLHPDEQFGPSDPGDFVAQSALKWAHDLGCEDHVVAREGRVSASKLGGIGYQHQQSYREGIRQRCRDQGTSYYTSQYTRPHDSGKANDQTDEGFYLDHADAYRAGGSALPRVYYSYEPHRYVTYWLFYSFNRPGSDLVADFDEHEGDWERISVRLDAQDRATEVAYYQHRCGPEIYTWDEANAEGILSGSHPTVYSANGSHASFPKAGSYTTPCDGEPPAFDSAARGQVWMTWSSLGDITSQPWYGFGGAWGHNGTFSHTTGPAGPRWKQAAPDGW